MLRRICAIVFLLLAALGVATAQPLDACVPEEPVHLEITGLIQQSAALALPARIERAFMLTLNAANDAYRHGEISKTLTLLRTFAFEVRSVKRAKRLPPATADTLIARAELAIGTLSQPR
jgi:hypothetical protein